MLENLLCKLEIKLYPVLVINGENGIFNCEHVILDYSFSGYKVG
jgi:hypothetical protein